MIVTVIRDHKYPEWNITLEFPDKEYPEGWSLSQARGGLTDDLIEFSLDQAKELVEKIAEQMGFKIVEEKDGQTTT